MNMNSKYIKTVFFWLYGIWRLSRKFIKNGIIKKLEKYVQYIGGK